MSMVIRPESPSGCAAVRDVNRLAFGQEEEARLVDALRDGGFARISLIAEAAGRIVGHILFSDLRIATSQSIVGALALAPLAEIPDRQRQGIGSLLVREGPRSCRDAGYRIMVVLGHPEFYPRFGFSATLAEGLKAPFSGPAFMALELVPGALEGIRSC